jgi:hypothetical protein
VAFTVLGKKVFEGLAFFQSFSLPVGKISGIQEPSQQNVKHPTQGTSLQKISFLGVVISEKVFKEILTQTHMRGHDIRTEENSSVLIIQQNNHWYCLI